jgi:hypothetical protein
MNLALVILSEALFAERRIWASHRVQSRYARLQ